MRKIYVIHGSLWEQRPLEYGENELVKPVIKEAYKIWSEHQGNLGMLIDELHTRALLPKLFRVILRPHNPTPVHRLYNYLQRKRIGIPNYPVIHYMTNAQVARVTTDFFLFNLKWINVSSNSVLSSDSPTQSLMESWTKIRSRGTKDSTSSPTAASSEPN
jgi:hypothetical protein